MKARCKILDLPIFLTPLVAIGFAANWLLLVPAMQDQVLLQLDLDHINAQIARLEERASRVDSPTDAALSPELIWSDLSEAEVVRVFQAEVLETVGQNDVKIRRFSTTLTQNLGAHRRVVTDIEAQISLASLASAVERFNALRPAVSIQSMFVRSIGEARQLENRTMVDVRIRVWGIFLGTTS